MSIRSTRRSLRLEVDTGQELRKMLRILLRGKWRYVYWAELGRVESLSTPNGTLLLLAIAL